MNDKTKQTPSTQPTQVSDERFVENFYKKKNLGNDESYYGGKDHAKKDGEKPESSKKPSTLDKK